MVALDGQIDALAIDQLVGNQDIFQHAEIVFARVESGHQQLGEVATQISQEPLGFFFRQRFLGGGGGAGSRQSAGKGTGSPHSSSTRRQKDRYSCSSSSSSSIKARSSSVSSSSSSSKPVLSPLSCSDALLAGEGGQASPQVSSIRFKRGVKRCNSNWLAFSAIFSRCSTKGVTVRSADSLLSP